MPKYKLIYGDVMGIGEPIRLLFTYLGEEFEDYRMIIPNLEVWKNEFKKKMPWGKMPVLEVDDNVVCQSVAICRYLGKMADLAGKDEWEDLLIDMNMDNFMDLRNELEECLLCEDESRKSEMKSKLITESIPFYYKRFDKIIEDNDGYLVNGKLTWADIFIGQFTISLSKFAEQELTDIYPNVKILQEKILNHPKLKHYIDNRPDLFI